MSNKKTVGKAKVDKDSAKKKKATPRPKVTKETRQKIANTKRQQTAKNKENLLKALKKSLGVVSTACDNVGITRPTFYSYLQNDSRFRQAVEEINERTLDFAESSLFRQIDEGNTTATIFYLKTRGKDRGYVERVENKVEFDNPFIEIIRRGTKEEDDK